MLGISPGGDSLCGHVGGRHAPHERTEEQHKEVRTETAEPGIAPP